MGTDAGESMARALTPLAVMRLLAEGPKHGYSVITQMRNAGFGHAQGGTVYPLLREMETDGLVESDWVLSANGPARKVFTLTPAGHEYLVRSERRLKNVLSRFESLTVRG